MSLFFKKNSQFAVVSIDNTKTISKTYELQGIWYFIAITSSSSKCSIGTQYYNVCWIQMQFQTSSFFDMIMTDVVVVFIKGALLLITNRYSSSTKKVEVVRKIRKCATLHGVSRPLGVEYLKFRDFHYRPFISLLIMSKPFGNFVKMYDIVSAARKFENLT